MSWALGKDRLACTFPGWRIPRHFAPSQRKRAASEPGIRLGIGCEAGGRGAEAPRNRAGQKGQRRARGCSGSLAGLLRASPQLRAGLIFLTLAVHCCYATDVEEIVQRATAAIKSDWAADPDYAYCETDETVKGEQSTRKTSQVVMIAGSDYYLPLAFDGQPLSPDRAKAELQKFRDEVQRRNSESPAARAQRIAKYKKAHDENGAILLESPEAFTFQLLREETMNGYPAWALSARPKKRTGPLSRAAKVLSGMQGTIWIERDSFHLIKVDAAVVTPVPIYGILARVLPGTHIEIDLTPVDDSTWLVSKFSMSLALSKIFFFKSTEVTRSTYTDFRMNSAVVDELLAR